MMSRMNFPAVLVSFAQSKTRGVVNMKGLDCVTRQWMKSAKNLNTMLQGENIANRIKMFAIAKIFISAKAGKGRQRHMKTMPYIKYQELKMQPITRRRSRNVDSFSAMSSQMIFFCVRTAVYMNVKGRTWVSSCTVPRRQ